MKKIIILLILSVLLFSCGKTPRDIANLTAPIAYAVAKNAVNQDTPQGEFDIKLRFENIKQEDGGWPSGEIKFDVLYGNNKAVVNYILSGSHVATAIVKLPNTQKKQFQVNLYENAVIFGQAQTVENYIKKLNDLLSFGLNSDLKVAVFEFQTVDYRKNLFGKHIAESLITYLTKKVTIVERKMLEPVLKELSFKETGLSKEKGVDFRKKIGKFLGADAIAIGTIKFSKVELILNGRIIDIEKGIVLSAGQVILPRYLVPGRDLKIFR